MDKNRFSLKRLFRKSHQLDTEQPEPTVLLPPHSVKRILVIKLRHFGDVLLTTPLLSTLKLNYPDASIDVLLYKGTEVMLAGNPAVLTHYTVDRQLKHHGLRHSLQGEWRLWCQLKKHHYDLIINLSDQWRAGLYCRLLTPYLSLGFCFPKRNHLLWGYCHHILVDITQHQHQHTVLNNLSILSPLHLPRQITKVAQPYQNADSETINHIYNKYSLTNYILIQPTARWAFKTWTTKSFSELINYLTASGETVVLTAGPSAEEQTLIDHILSRCNSSEKIISLVGQLKLTELAVMISRAKLFIGVDSVPMHMAAALQTPMVVLFGPSNLKQWHPWEASYTLLWAGDYRPLPKPDEVDTNTSERYLEAIPVSDVIQAVQNQLTLLEH